MEMEWVDETMLLVKLWILADRFMITSLQDLVMIRLKGTGHEWCYSIHPWILYIWENTLLGGELRKFDLLYLLCLGY